MRWASSIERAPRLTWMARFRGPAGCAGQTAPMASTATVRTPSIAISGHTQRR